MRRENISSLGTIVTSLLATVCCMGPAVAMATGVSLGFLGALEVLDPYRPWLLGAAFVMLAYSFRRLYLSPSRCASEEPPASGRISRGVFLAGAGLFVLALAYRTVVTWVLG